jgi:hypothetical protein
MQAIGFGRLERLYVRSGEPLFDPAPLILRTLKLAGSGINEPRPELSLQDFVLKREVQELFRQLDALGDGVVERIEVVHGLPHLMVVAQVPTLAG